MSQKIESLTKEQEALLPVYRDKWIEIGTNCEPCDFERAKAALTPVYQAAGLEPPGQVYLVDSPIQSCYASAILSEAKQWPSQKNLEGWLNDPDTLQRLRGEAAQHLHDQIYGSHDAGWLSFYDYLYEVCHLECCKPFLGLIELAKCCGWWSPYREVAILQHRHCELHRDAQGRLHHESKAAVLYRDGFAVYAWNGVRVPKKVIVAPKTITVQDIESEANAEVRRVMIVRYGFDRFLADARFQHVMTDDFGALYRKQFESGAADTIQVVKVVNSTPEPDGSFKDYVIGCSQTARTAHEAVAASFGLTPKEYAPEIET